MPKHISPEFEATSFHCPHCNVLAKQTWYAVHGISSGAGKRRLSDAVFAICSHCERHTIWNGEEQVYPSTNVAPPPHDDMPTDVKADYLEAAEILSKSPRGAAALLRLGLQKLMKELGEPGKNINNDIGSLVRKGLPEQVQKTLDSLRVVGNEAVHPGQINLNETPETALTLFQLMNFIVQNRITQPNTIDAIYAKLPETKRKAIEDRDGAK